MSNSSRNRQAQEIENILISRLPIWRNADGRLPSETDLAAEFGVSRVTIREALASLERRGLILRLHGLGTFVNRRAVDIETRLEESIEFSELIRLSGHEAGMRFIECAQVCLYEEDANQLQVQPGAPAVRIRKVFTADGQPVIFCTNLIPLDLASPGSHAEILSQIDPMLSIYAILQLFFGQAVDHQISEAEACSANGDLAYILDCSLQAPLFRISEVGYTQQQQPVFTGDTYYLPGLIRFRLVRKPIYTIIMK